MSLTRHTFQVLKKDIRLEWRTRARLNALVFFALSTLLLFSFALGPDTRLLQKNAGGYLWLTLLISSTLSLGESFRIEAENDALEGLRLIPVDGRAIFLGKALGNALTLMMLGLAILPPAIALFDVHFVLGFPRLALVLALGSLAISAPGTVYSAISSFARARDVLLPLMLFPLLIPALLAASKASALIFQGDPMNQYGSWISLLAGFNLIYWGLGFTLFPYVIEG